LRVAQIIQSAPSLTVLRTLLTLLPDSLVASLSKQAGGGNGFTLFAPSDAAFRCARAARACVTCCLHATRSHARARARM
jgi:hypothetical protein